MDSHGKELSSVSPLEGVSEVIATAVIVNSGEEHGKINRAETQNLYLLDTKFKGVSITTKLASLFCIHISQHNGDIQCQLAKSQVTVRFTLEDSPGARGVPVLLLPWPLPLDGPSGRW